MSTPGELDRRKAALSPQQSAALERRIHAGRTHRGCSIPPATREAPIPLSFAQERIWLHQQLVPECVVYNRLASIRLRGPLRLEFLRQAWDDVVARHESLRTTIQCTEGKPTLCAHAHVSTEWPFIDLSGEPTAERQAGQVTQQEVRRPFDLTEGPLWRSRLIGIGENNHLLLLTFHHIVFDAWSLGVLLEELAQLYEGHATHVPTRPAPLALQYADFAAYDRTLQRVGAFEKGRAYWQRALSHPPVLRLPTDVPPRPQPSEEAGHVDIHLPSDLVARLRELAGCEQTTIFSVLLAAYTVLLHRYTGDTDVVVGCPVANRNPVETEPLIGVFINTLPLRITFDAADTFRQLLQRVGAVVVAGLEHQEVPFQFLVQDVLADRETGGSPLFQTMFIYERLPLHPRTAASVTFEPEENGPVATMVDLALELMESAKEVGGRCVYRCELWEKASIERMIGQFQTLLEGIVANPDQRISELPLLTARERQQLLVDWNNTAAAYPRDKCVHQLFEEQVERTPGAVAVRFENLQLTYAELNARSNQLARYLRGHGVGTEVLVGISLERSLEMVVGILGILKAGGAYLPIDTAYPPERLTFMLQDSKAPVLLTQRRGAAKCPASQVNVIDLDTKREKFDREMTSNLHPVATPDNLAYVIYTSGSTGQPKGVQVTHRAVVNLLCSMARQPGLTSEDTLLAVTTLAFDIAGLELYLPLSVGARVVLATREVAADGDKLLDLLDASGTTVMQATPATWRLLLDAGWKGTTNLKVLCGGEALPRELADALLARSTSVWNMYGPTETTIWSATSPVVPGPGPVTLGPPIANTELYVLDMQGQPVPVGVAGELHIGGDGVAHGYRNRPELTAEKFIPDPFRGDSRYRLYKTGDRVRYRAEGALEFLGRLDSQVKIRGFRIETSEVEAVLKQYPGLRECAVVAREPMPGDKRLVAYFVAAQPPPGAGDLRRFLSLKLPSYMVPATFVPLEALPYTANGKIDRRALPAPNDPRPERETNYAAPCTPLEQQLAAIWREVLQRKEIGRHDNFFALGGHSLTATQILARIRRQFNVDIPLRTLFERPTVEGLACSLLEFLLDEDESEAKEESPDASQAIVDERATMVSQASGFQCPQAPSEWFGRRTCQLFIVINEMFEAAAFHRLAKYVRELDSSIDVEVVDDTPVVRARLASHPTLIFSPALIRHFRCERGRVFCGYPMSKSGEYAALAKAGVPVPHWGLLTETETPDLSRFDDYVVRKPDYGGRGAKVVIVRKSRLKWKPIATQVVGESPALIVQKFIYTGLRPVSYRVSTLFGKVLYSAKYKANDSLPELRGPKDFRSPTGTRKDGVSIVATARSCQVSLNYEDEIIRLGESAHAAFPEIPLLGFDIVREVPSGKLYVLEANAIGYIWNFNSRTAEEYGVSFEEQFDGVRKAAFILAEKTQQLAC